MIQSKFIIVLICIFLCTKSAFAQTPEWINYNDPIYPTSIVDDGNYVWIGTYGGLIRFDKFSETMTYYNKANGGLPENRVLSIAIDSSKNVWVGTQNSGIARFDGNNTVVYNMQNSGLPLDYWNSKIEVDPNGNIWIGSFSFLSSFNGVEWENYELAPNIVSSHSINDILFDYENATWIGDSRGLHKLVSNHVYFQVEGINTNISALQNDTSDNSLWVGSEYEGLFHYSGLKWNQIDTSNSILTSNCIFEIQIDSKENKWFGTDNGLLEYDGTNWQLFNKNNSDLPYDIIRCFSIDQNDVFWIGAPSSLIRFDGENVKSYKLHNNGIVNNRVVYVEEDENSNIWISCESSLTKFDGKIWEIYDSTNFHLLDGSFNPIYNDSVMTLWSGSNLLILFKEKKKWIISKIDNKHKGTELKEDYNGNIWLSDYLGLHKFDGIRWETYDKNNSPLPTNYIRELAIDYDNNLWLSTLPGMNEKGMLIRYNGLNWSTFYSCDAFHHWVASIEIDSLNNKWIGILTRDYIGNEFGGGIKKFTGSEITSYNISNSPLPSNSVTELCLDNYNNLWIGTYAGGCAKFNCGDQWTTYDKNNSGLPENNVEVISVDSKDNKWFGVQFNGLTVFREDGVILTGIESPQNQNLVNSFTLYQNYPNPFNPKSNIKYQIAKAGLVSLFVYNILGRKIYELVNEYKSPGTYEIEFDGSDLSSGVYFYRLTSGKYSETKKLILMK